MNSRNVRARLNSGQTVSLGDVAAQNGDYSHFSVGNPVYNLGFTLTPGLAPTVFVDIAVWSDQWQWPVWFPQLAISLPPGGMNFSCHAGTTCVIDFQPVYNAATGQVQDMSKERDVADRTLTGGGKCQPNGRGRELSLPRGRNARASVSDASNSAVLSCGALIPTSTDQILRRGGCTEEGQRNASVPVRHDGPLRALCEKQGGAFLPAEMTGTTQRTVALSARFPFRERLGLSWRQ